jgi:hypothetical protein
VLFLSLLFFVCSFVFSEIPPPAAVRSAQCGAFTSLEESQECIARLIALGCSPVWTVEEDGYTKVLVGKCERLIDAIILKNSLRGNGFPDSFTRSFKNHDGIEFKTIYSIPDPTLLKLERQNLESIITKKVAERQDLSQFYAASILHNDADVINEGIILLGTLNNNDPARGFVLKETARSLVRRDKKALPSIPLLLKVTSGEVASEETDRLESAWMVADCWHYFVPDRIKAYRAYNEILSNYSDIPAVRVRAKVEIVACLLELAQSESAYYNEVRRAALDLLETEPKSFRRAHAVVDLMFAESYMFEGRKEDALASIDGFEERWPGRTREIAFAKELAGQALAKLGRYNEAVEQFESVLAMDFSDPDENYYWGGEQWDIKLRSAVWLRSYASDYGDTKRYEQYNEYIKTQKNKETAQDTSYNYCFPHSFYERTND